MYMAHLPIVEQNGSGSMLCPPYHGCRGESSDHPSVVSHLHLLHKSPAEGRGWRLCLQHLNRAKDKAGMELELEGGNAFSSVWAWAISPDTLTQLLQAKEKTESFSLPWTSLTGMQWSSAKELRFQERPHCDISVVVQTKLASILVTPNPENHAIIS